MNGKKTQHTAFFIEAADLRSIVLFDNMSCLDYVEDIYLAGRLLHPSLKLFSFHTICIISLKTVYTVYCMV